MRLCDYLVDPIYSTASTEGPDVAHERFEGISSPSSASDAGISHVIGLSIEQFAPAVAALSDHEEMVLALVHPLVQVYTIPRTGQLAYVGHICNFRQKCGRVPLPLASDARRYAICSSVPADIQGPFAGEGTLQGRCAEVAAGV